MKDAVGETEEAGISATQDGVGRPWVLTVVFEVMAGFEAEFLRLMEVPLNAMRHEESFVSASLSAHPEDPGKFFMHEVWKSRDDFVNSQIYREYRAEYEERTVPMLRTKRVYSEWYEIRADYAVHIRR